MRARTTRQIAFHPLARARAAARRAFTLIELMVAVGAVALIAVGLAAVFASVGDTVTGGRSVSGFTAYASLMERELRDDISKMSRDGFLLIVNQEAEGGAEVELYAGQPRARGAQPASHQQRPRRIDEMVFFRKGDFTSGREPLGPGYTARGNSAMIYYGHGTRQPVDERVNSVYAFPRVSDQNHDAYRLGERPQEGSTFPNPNRYASEWGLLRLQVALTGGAASLTDFPELFRLPPATRSDQDTQVGAQPAARSAFRALADVPAPLSAGGGGGGLGTARGTVRSAAITGETPDTHPLFASGLVDAATTGMDEIRKLITSPMDPAVATTQSGPFEFRTPGDRPFTTTPFARVTAYEGIVAPFAVQQGWMLDALPAPSVGFEAAPGQQWTPSTPYLPNWQQTAPVESDVRVRYELAPPAYLEPMSLQPLARAVRLADQMALTSPLLVPRCSEFIVEWSFGKVAEDGSLIWHGAERRVDLNGDGTIAADEIAAQPYLDNDDVRFALPYRLLEPAPPGVDRAFADPGDLFGSYPVSPQLIHGFASPSDEWTYNQGGRQVLASFFGYIDTTFNPADPGQPSGLAGLPPSFPAASAPPSAADFLPWAWPELIRITVSLADPADPAIEQTFQFVFQAPGNPAP